MPRSTLRPPRRNWLIPTALIALALVPVLAGAARLIDLATSPRHPSPPASTPPPCP